MENYLRDPIKVSIELLYPDPNNPRLALEDKPGYGAPGPLFDEEMRKRILEQLGETAYDVESLVQAIVGQGWMAIDNIIVWHHPNDSDRWVVVEGNRRRLALERIRGPELSKARRKLERMRAKPVAYPAPQIEEQEQYVARLEQIAQDTDQLAVVPIAADTVDELVHMLPRVLAARHINGAKDWGNYAQDLWLLTRYHQLFADKHGRGHAVSWDPDVVGKVADEASLGHTVAKRQLKAASWYSRFCADWEDKLPAGERFERSDYYLFENISKKPWVRSQLGIGESDTRIPAESETALFKWIFAKPRGKTADQNPNIFYRHENIVLWDQIQRYDQQNGTSFAARFDVTMPDEAPTMNEVEAEWRMHKVRRKPHDVLDELLRRLEELPADTLRTEGRVLRVQLERLREHAEQYIKMIDATEA